MSHLYEIATEYRALESCIADETDEGVRDAMRAQLDAVAATFEVKAEAVIRFIRNTEAEAVARKAEEERLAKSRKSFESRAGYLKEYLADMMHAVGCPKVAAGVFTARFQNNPPALDVVDETKIPADYWHTPEPVAVLDRAAVKDALKAGLDVPGARLTVGESLRIA